MDGEQRRNVGNNGGGDARYQQRRRAGIPLSYGGFSAAVYLLALLIVSLVCRGIPLARAEAGLATAVRHRRRLAIHNPDRIVSSACSFTLKVLARSLVSLQGVLKTCPLLNITRDCDTFYRKWLFASLDPVVPNFI